MAEREAILEAVAQRKAETRKYGVYLENSMQSSLAEMLGICGAIMDPEGWGYILEGFTCWSEKPRCVSENWATSRDLEGREAVTGQLLTYQVEYLNIF